MTPDEWRALDALSTSRTAPGDLALRATIVRLAAAGATVAAVAADSDRSQSAVRNWIRRFNTEGLAGLEHRGRADSTYTAEQREMVIGVALTDPRNLGLDDPVWSLDRLLEYLTQKRGVPISRSRLYSLVCDASR